MANPLTHYCPKCKETVPLRPSSELELNRDERDHVFECADCGQSIDVDDPRQDDPAAPAPVPDWRRHITPSEHRQQEAIPAKVAEMRALAETAAPKREIYILQSFDEKEARWMWEEESGPLSMMIEILKANVHTNPTTGFRLQLL